MMAALEGESGAGAAEAAAAVDAAEGAAEERSALGGGISLRVACDARCSNAICAAENAR